MMQKRKRYTRLFTWTSPENKGKLNLMNYSTEIDEAVNQVLPYHRKITVSICNDDFLIDSTAHISHKEFNAICKKIAKTKAIGQLGTHYHYKNSGRSVQIFRGKDITE